MDDVFLGEIRYVAFSYAPQGWAICAGQSLEIRQSTALFALLGTTYGGDGVTTFKLPDFQGRIAVSQGQGTGLSPYNLGQTGGAESVTLTTAQTPPHTHSVAAGAGSGTTSDPTGGVFAKPVALRGGNLYASTTDSQAAADTIAPAGSGQAHENRAAGLALTAIIALQGIFPQRP